jgi:hypothetical protein
MSSGRSDESFLPDRFMPALAVIDVFMRHAQPVDKHDCAGDSANLRLVLWAIGVCRYRPPVRE